MGHSWDTPISNERFQFEFASLRHLYFQTILEDKDEILLPKGTQQLHDAAGYRFFIFAQSTEKPFLSDLFQERSGWSRQQNTILFSIRSRCPNRKMFADLKISISKLGVSPGETRWNLVHDGAPISYVCWSRFTPWILVHYIYYSLSPPLTSIKRIVRSTTNHRIRLVMVTNLAIINQA